MTNISFSSVVQHLRQTAIVLASLLAIFTPARAAHAAEMVDVLVYGATPGGIAAAIAAAKGGSTVALIEPTPRIGGLVTSGLSHTDFRTFEGLNGTFLDFARRVEAHYVKENGADSAQVRESFRGTFGEPKVNLAIFEAMLVEQPKITVERGLRLASVKLDKSGDRARVESATFTKSVGTPGSTQQSEFQAKVFIDGTYEGDLMAMAGAPWRVGREGKAEYNESLAPDEADDQLQAYNFRWIMTRDPKNRVTPTAPAGYRREDFVEVLKVLETGSIKKIFAYPSGCIFKAQLPPLPNGKFDINDVSNGLIRLSLPGKNLAWPNGDAAARAAVFQEHVRDQVGLLYFLQNDPEVPAKFRDEAREWGWCRDEFEASGHMPPQLYVREARRLKGVHIYTQQDSAQAPGDARAVLHRQAIAMGDYGNNCHGTLHPGPRFGGKHTGEFYNAVPPYQVPYGVIVPAIVQNLLVPVAVSSSHVGFCALRLEPIWASLGQAAGYAAAHAVKNKIAVQEVPVPELQRQLHADQSATIYVSDVLPGHADFAAVQWWGSAGGLHGLQAPFAKPGQRGKNISGQYYEAYQGHAAELDKKLEPAQLERWLAIAKELRLPLDKLPAATASPTRGDFIRAAWK
ncbi:FAD dependent oxidoreductase [Anatilimnocola aggregata]|uniref:FAD dependent oxidoreductase n=2 Tax=Anatilimnocola aggregata TaxID=2528021 RepID=A0A517YI65_9BACT|nr:FAD dependent oxidoreductase [Anatilimnocola aggregata]